MTTNPEPISVIKDNSGQFTIILGPFMLFKVINVYKKKRFLSAPRQSTLVQNS